MTPGADTVEISMKFFTLEIDIMYDPALPLPRHISKVCISYFRDLTGCASIAAVFTIVKKQKLTRMYISEWMENENVLFIYYGIILFGSSNRNYQRHRLTSPIKVGTGSKNIDWGIPDPERSFSLT